MSEIDKVNVDPAGPSALYTGAYGWASVEAPDKPPVTSVNLGEVGELDGARGTSGGDGNIG